MDLPTLLAHRRLRLLAGFIVGGATLVTVVLGGLVLFGGGDDQPFQTPTPIGTPTATPTAAPSVLAAATDLRSAPSDRVAIVARLSAGVSLRIDGRDATGQWLAVTVISDPAVHGWVVRDSVAGAPDINGLALVASPPTPTPVPTATAVPEAPDLAVASIVSKGNQLVVTLENRGSTDITGTIRLSINGAEPQPIDVKVGEPLLAGDHVELQLAGEYVQRRGRVSIAASIDPHVSELDDANNRLEVVVVPDLPNDLAIVNANIAEGSGLLVSVRNNSPIPIAGTVSVDIRDVATNTLLGRRRVDIELFPEELAEVDFPAVEELDFTRTTIQLFSDALDDADFANNTFPR